MHGCRSTCDQFIVIKSHCRSKYRFTMTSAHVIVVWQSRTAANLIWIYRYSIVTDSSHTILSVNRGSTAAASIVELLSDLYCYTRQKIEACAPPVLHWMKPLSLFPLSFLPSHSFPLIHSLSFLPSLSFISSLSFPLIHSLSFLPSHSFPPFPSLSFIPSHSLSLIFLLNYKNPYALTLCS